MLPFYPRQSAPVAGARYRASPVGSGLPRARTSHWVYLRGVAEIGVWWLMRPAALPQFQKALDKLSGPDPLAKEGLEAVDLDGRIPMHVVRVKAPS